MSEAMTLLHKLDDHYHKLIEAARREARREALEEAARHLEEEADVLDAHRAELIASGTLNGRRVANEALRKRLARDNRVIIEKLLFDAQYLRAALSLPENPEKAG